MHSHIVEIFVFITNSTISGGKQMQVRILCMFSRGVRKRVGDGSVMMIKITFEYILFLFEVL